MLFLLVVNLFWPPQDQAERLYDNAITFMNAGKYKEALTDFDTIIQSFGDTPWAPQALLKLSTYYLDVEKNTGQALTYLNQLQTRYASSPQAPGAYYYKALIASRVGKTRADLEAATADLVRMNNLFPDNPWQGGALFLFGHLTLRLGDYRQSLSHFQRLEFSDPSSPYLEQAWLHSADAAFLDGNPHQSALILARLQARFPNGDADEIASNRLCMLDRFKVGKPSYALDKTFFGGAPKTFPSPTQVAVSGDGILAVRTSKNYSLIPLEKAGERRTTPNGGLANFGKGPAGELLLVYNNRVVSHDSKISFKSLGFNGVTLDNIKDAAMDSFGRLYVIDGDKRVLLVYNREGGLIKQLSVSKAKSVASYRDGVIALGGDGSFRRFNANLENDGFTPGNLRSVIDFTFDYFGNLYVVHEKGAQLTIYTHKGAVAAQFNLKSGAFPLKQAQALAVDPSGAVYLADRRGGAVYRFH